MVPVLPVDDPAVYDLQDDDPLRTVLQEIRHLLLQHRLHFMLGDHLQVIPRRLAPALHLTQVLLQLVKVHLENMEKGPRSSHLRPRFWSREVRNLNTMRLQH